MTQNPEIEIVVQKGKIGVAKISLPEGGKIILPPDLREVMANLYLAGDNQLSADLPSLMGDDPDSPLEE